ncbi:MAG: hypothetical protein ACFCUU_04940, partial [Cyclobacteriaceae bacterium]
MKNLLFLILITFQVQAFGQGLSGRFQLGGTGSYALDQIEQEYPLGAFMLIDKNRSRTISIFPQLGYFINDNVLIGGRIGYANEKNELLQSYFNYGGTIDNSSNTNVWKVGPFVRFHKSLNNQILLFLEGNVDLGFGSKEYKRLSHLDEKIFQLEAGVRPGFLLLITSKLGIESTFGF